MEVRAVLSPAPLITRLWLSPRALIHPFGHHVNGFDSILLQSQRHLVNLPIYLSIALSSPPPPPSLPPSLPSLQWQSLLDPYGRIKDFDQLKKRVFYGGLHPDLRKEVSHRETGY